MASAATALARDNREVLILRGRVTAHTIQCVLVVDLLVSSHRRGLAGSTPCALFPKADSGAVEPIGDSGNDGLCQEAAKRVEYAQILKIGVPRHYTSRVDIL